MIGKGDLFGIIYNIMLIGMNSDGVMRIQEYRFVKKDLFVVKIIGY